ACACTGADSNGIMVKFPVTSALLLCGVQHSHEGTCMRVAKIPFDSIPSPVEKHAVLLCLAHARIRAPVERYRLFRLCRHIGRITGWKTKTA
ncbi:hypothetical protein, partial [Sulfitobacter sp. HI0129]|uniref:hypothetical protein n=1 Tax=Sulfitobacter sp. HI0129 TaxID=1822268 RepID=UPI001F31C449